MKIARLVAIFAGLIGFVLCVITPALPVTQTTASVSWPQKGSLNSITVPLISQVPLDLTISIPCTAVASLPADGGMLVGTSPSGGKDASLNGLFVRATADRVDVADRNVVIASAPRSEVQSAACSSIDVRSDQNGTTATFTGLTGTDGKPLTKSVADPNLRPQIVGIFTDLTGAVPAKLSVNATIDTRFTTSPTVIKLTAIVVGILLGLISLVALGRLDALDGRGRLGFLARGWWRPKWVDGVVVVAVLVWHMIGANTSDDGYILTMARTANHAGYMANYYRWFGVPEDPFGWYYNVLALMAKVSDLSIWMRLPDLIAALVSWLIISREVLPRLGRRIRTSRVALWAAAFGLLATFLPLDNGLRPEPIIALGALLTWVSIERAVATGRMLPAAVAVVIAAFTLGIQPTGLIAVAALLAGGRPMLRILVRRRREVGTLALIAPILAAGVLVVPVVFSDQTIASVIEATRIRTAIGPSLSWYEELVRYYYLMLPTVDGSVSRRFGFLLTVLSLFTVTFMLLRRKRIAGTARGPAWRLVGVIYGTIFFMAFTPTKWTHHFGLYATIAAPIAALAAVYTTPLVLRSRRNRVGFTAALFFVLALSFAGPNGWWYVSSYGIPFFDSAIKVGGVAVSAVFLAAAIVLALYAGWLHFRPPAPGAGRDSGRSGLGWAVPAIAGFVVLVEFASFGIGAIKQYPAYSLASSNFRALSGNSCSLADDVLVESNANSGVLQPVPGQPSGPLGPLGGADPVGFDPNGVPDTIPADSVTVEPGQPGTSNTTTSAGTAGGESAGTAGGQGTRGVNGSTVALPFGLNPADTPVVGSYSAGAQQESNVTSSWYALPPRDKDHPLLAISASGRIAGRNLTGRVSGGQSLVVEYGQSGPDGQVRTLGEVVPYDIGPSPSWRNLRVPLSEVSADANVVRIVAQDKSLGTDEWLAFTPPRVSALQTLQQYVGSSDPVLIDWAVGLAFPCQRPMDHFAGVTEVPKFRITPDHDATVQSTDSWQAGENGGLLGITDMLLGAYTVPTYLRDDWGRDWGSLEQYVPLKQAVQGDIDLGTAKRSGLWKPGQIRVGF